MRDILRYKWPHDDRSVMQTTRDRYKVIYMDKVKDQIQTLLDKGLIATGNSLGSLLILKGDLTFKDLNSGLLSGADGDAFKAALTHPKMGYAPDDWSAFATRTADGEDFDSRELRDAIIAADVQTVIISDSTAQTAFRNAFADELADLPDLLDALLAPGQVVKVQGMRVLNLDGFEKSLGSKEQKTQRWKWLLEVPALREPLS